RDEARSKRDARAEREPHRVRDLDGNTEARGVADGNTRTDARNDVDHVVHLHTGAGAVACDADADPRTDVPAPDARSDLLPGDRDADAFADVPDHLLPRHDRAAADALTLADVTGHLLPRHDRAASDALTLADVPDHLLPRLHPAHPPAHAVAPAQPAQHLAAPA